jgi:hypothetical protein
LQQERRQEGRDRFNGHPWQRNMWEDKLGSLRLAITTFARKFPEREYLQELLP